MILVIDKTQKGSLACLGSVVNPLLAGNPKRGTQAYSADPDQMEHNAASDQGLDC